MNVALSVKTMAEPPSRKKRTRRDRSPDSDAEKRRGRPRVDKQDESAADRRRTQIRLAQRAYRQRKESSLDELRRRVSELTTTIELMNKSFSECKERLCTSTLEHGQMMDLEDLSSQFELFVKDARNPSEERKSQYDLLVCQSEIYSHSSFRSCNPAVKARSAALQQ